MVVYALNDLGDFTELMTIPLSSSLDSNVLVQMNVLTIGPKYGHFISFGEDDDYIFAYGDGRFWLVSLKNKRVVDDGSEVQKISLMISFRMRCVEEAFRNSFRCYMRSL